jgi:hypothetical protein
MTADTHRYRSTVLRDRDGNIVEAVPPDINDVDLLQGLNGHPDAEAYRKALERVEREFEKRGDDVTPAEWLGFLQCREYLVEIDNAELDYARARLGT